MFSSPLKTQDFQDDQNRQCKFIIVTGGVLSGIGKGVCASSIGRLLKSGGMRPTHVKIDPYINKDAGTMSPFEHGEVFVLDDGGETDLDLGNYERFVDITLTQNSNLTTGKIYAHVIEKERRGDYLGKTVQIVPHLTNAIQEWIEKVAATPVDKTGLFPNICIVELGGTVGDIESAPFVEALRQLQLRLGRQNCVFCHVSLVPTMSDEQKSKPTQHSVQVLRSLGLFPDFLFCRSKEMLKPETIEKLSLFSQVKKERVISVFDVPNMFHVPLVLQEQGFCKQIAHRLKVSDTSMIENPNMQKWTAMAKKIDTVVDKVQIAMVGKYTNNQDAYLSVVKALEHAALAVNRKLVIQWIEAQDLVVDDKNQKKFDDSWKQLKESNGILVPGGFGERGLEGKIQAINYARTSNVPYLGICLGMQAAVIEYARNVCEIPNANSEEFSQSRKKQKVKEDQIVQFEEPTNVIIFMPEGDKTQMGGTMRLGSRKTVLTEGSIASKLYENQTEISERHRHRYEVDPIYAEQLQEKGLIFSGVNRDQDINGERMEVVELTDHKFFLATQYHPEFKSRPERPSPPFVGLLKASI